MTQPNPASNPLRPTPDQAAAAWAALVDADADQVQRLREPAPEADHYTGVAQSFRPAAPDNPELEVLAALAQPTDTWLDIGAGGGRFALPLAARVHRLIAIEPSEAMRTVLQQGITEANLDNLQVHDTRWPAIGWDHPVDVALAAHSLYDIRQPIPFIEAMERTARRLCIVALARHPRGAQLAPLFEAVHGEPLHTLPALNEFVALLAALDRPYELRRVTATRTPQPTTREDAIALARRLLWLQPGTEKDTHLARLIDDDPELPIGPREIGIVTWRVPNQPA